MRGEALDVDFVNDQLFEPEIRGSCALPVKVIIDDDGLRNDRGVVAMILDGLAGRRLRIVGEQEIVGGTTRIRTSSRSSPVLLVERIVSTVEDATAVTVVVNFSHTS